MNKLFLVGLITLSGPLQGALAQTDTAVPPGEMMIGSQKFLMGPSGVNILKNAVQNPDGTRTIKKGSIPPELNELNKKYCESRGGKDITNDGDTIIGSETQYVVICTSTDVSKKRSSGVQTVPASGIDRVFLPLPSPELNNEKEAEKNSPYTEEGTLITPFVTD